MDNYRSTVIERTVLTFGIEGLVAREDLLFKAFIRLLVHQTHQQWVYQPVDDKLPVDLLVVGSGHEPAQNRLPSQQPQPLLRINHEGQEGVGVLCWPLKPDSLEKELNRLGGLVVRQRAAQQAPAAPLGAGGWSDPADTPSNLMRLQQWPPQRLLAGTGRMRLATLLTGKAMSLDELVQRSALPLALCQAFVSDLRQAQLLVTPGLIVKPGSERQQSQALPKLVQPGLLSRIRLRLGI